MDIEQLYRDFGIQYVKEGHKHARQGWVNCQCPFCSGHSGYHLGYDTNDNKFVCWRCGGKNIVYAISAILKVSKSETIEIIKKYHGYYKKTTQQKKVKIHKPFKLPPCNYLQQNHKDYLISRNFDPDKLVHDWGILGTGVSAVIDKIDYKHRIIIPYFLNNEMVSFDCRDITGKSEYKYLACSEQREIIPHKNFIYGNQKMWGNTGICVEGCTDVWRMGKYSFAVSGIKYTPQQVRFIAKNFKRVIVMFDPEPQAQIQAKILINELKFRGVDAFNFLIENGNDPGDLSQSEADYIVKQII